MKGIVTGRGERIATGKSVDNSGMHCNSSQSKGAL